MHYASASGRAGLCFEIQMGMIDRGAEISWLSQYPHEKEILFAPLTGLEVVGSRVDGGTLVAEMRLSVNLNSLTIEQVVSKRRKIVKEMCENMKSELRLEVGTHPPHPVQGPVRRSSGLEPRQPGSGWSRGVVAADALVSPVQAWSELRALMKKRFSQTADVGETALRVLDTKLAALDQYTPEYYNESDANLMKVIGEAVEYKRQVSEWPHKLPGLMSQEHTESDDGGPLGAFGKAQDFATEVVALRDEVLQGAPFAAVLGVERAQALLREFEAKVAAAREKEERVRAGLAIFGGEAPVLAEGDMQTIDAVLVTLGEAWGKLGAWEGLVAKSRPLPLPDAARQAEDLRRQCKMMADRVEQLKRDAPAEACASGGILEELAARVTTLERLVELSELLTRPTLRERHRDAIGAALRRKLEKAEKLTLGMLLERGVEEYHAAVSEATASAEGEAKIEEALGEMGAEWDQRSLSFEVLSEESGAQLLVSAEVKALLGLLEEHDTQTRAMAASRYAKPMQADVAKWQKELGDLRRLLSSWLTLQQEWQYYTQIFSSASLKEQISDAAASFETVDRWIQKIVRAAIREPKARLVGEALRKAANAENSCKTMQDFFAVIDDMQRVMKEDVARRCSEHLETVRLAFPRAYFVSNDELFSIIESRTVDGVQPHLLKLFDGVKRVEVSDDGETATAVVGTFADDRLPLEPPVKLHEDGAGGSRGIRPVQVWVGEVEAGMKAACRAALQRAVETRESEAREAWLFALPACLIFAANKIWLTAQCELALAETVGSSRNAKFEAVETQAHEHLMLLSRLAAGSELDKRGRMSVQAGISLAVWERDSVQTLRSSGASSVGSFDWQMQMRMYATPQATEYQVTVEMADASRPYGWELLATNGRLVVTPLTVRIYISILSGFASSSLAAPAGPAGTPRRPTPAPPPASTRPPPHGLPGGLFSVPSAQELARPRPSGIWLRLGRGNALSSTARTSWTTELSKSLSRALRFLACGPVLMSSTGSRLSRSPCWPSCCASSDRSSPAQSHRRFSRLRARSSTPSRTSLYAGLELEPPSSRLAPDLRDSRVRAPYPHRWPSQ